MTEFPDVRATVASSQPSLDLGYARLDLDRAARTGDPEVVYGAGKSPSHVVELLTRLHEAHPDRAVLATRLSAEAMELIRSELTDATLDETAGAATVGPIPNPRGHVAIVSAGTSDAAVAHEVAITTRVFGAGAQLINDVGVAGLHRVMAVRGDLAAADCLVVVAGMEGALPSVVGGLTGVPLVAVPTSVGYGASFGGLAALLGMLNSCAPGVAVVNIDNGFGAGVFAARVARNAQPRRRDASGADGTAGTAGTDDTNAAGASGSS
jgi:NCAIR mutase (PurE)-related protein